MNILSFNYGHDSSACVIIDGQIRAAIAEERLTRAKNDASFPYQAIHWCLDWCGLSGADIDIVASAGTTMRMDCYHFFDFPESYPPWPENLKLLAKREIKKHLPGSTASLNSGVPLYIKKVKLRNDCQIVCVEHHTAHAASAYYTSGLGEEKAVIVTMDGIGDTTSSATWVGERNKLRQLSRHGGESSIGWFYGNATEGLGWRHGSDEWKVMGLAPYGNPSPGSLKGFHPEFINGQLHRPHDYGAFGIWQDHGSNHFHGRDASKLSVIAEQLGREDFSAEVQRTVEEQMMEFIVPTLRQERTRTLCCAGGCFLNVKFNQRLWNSGELDHQWVYPDPGDAGLAVGAGLYVFHQKFPEKYTARIQDLYWGPSFTDSAIEKTLSERGITYTKPDNLSRSVADLLMNNYAVGWFQGRMEAGPRALGGRSILMSPLRAENKDRINAMVKYREAFRPFCPSLLAESRDTYLRGARDEFFMITSFDSTPEKRDKIPAVVHVDGTVRPQLVQKETNSGYYDLIKTFGELSGESVLLNTSFNVKGEPIVCSPREAIRCFFDTGLEALALGSFLVLKPGLQRE